MKTDRMKFPAARVKNNKFEVTIYRHRSGTKISICLFSIVVIPCIHLTDTIERLILTHSSWITITMTPIEERIEQKIVKIFNPIKI